MRRERIRKPVPYVPSEKRRAYYQGYDHRRRLALHGLSEEQYDALFKEQNGVCAICKKPEGETDPRYGTARRLTFDHCHQNNKFRGLLCGKCNKALGLFGDSAEILSSALKYLSRHLPMQS